MIKTDIIPCLVARFLVNLLLIEGPILLKKSSKMKHSMYISFQVKKSKVNKKGLAPINMRVTLDGKRFELSTHRSISPDSWDVILCCATGESDEARILNNYLNSLRNNVQRQYNILESLGKEITVDTLKSKLIGETEKKYSLLDVFQYHNDEMKQKVGIDIATGTYKHFISTKKRVEEFLSFQYKKDDILLDELNYAFVTKFEVYLKSIQKCAHNTTTKYIRRLKKIINMAMANEWIIKDPFLKYKCTYKQTNREYLTHEELNLLWDKNIKIPRLDKVRDIFLFCCYTGLAWSDVAELNFQDIRTGIDGEKWIIIYRKKTENRSPIPILPQAQSILDKYENDPMATEKGKLLPVSSNQRMNGYLKEIADICGITKNLTMHLARHTFATTVTLSNGVPIETVSKMLGHTSIKTTQIYSKVVDSKISQDMQVLKDKLNQNNIKKAV